VLRIADLLGCSRTPAHADESSILLLDRPAIEWSDGRQRGVGWIEAEIWTAGAPVAGWKDAARRGLNGLVLEGRKRFLHTSVNGIAPVYWLKEDGATYFASRIDPLVRSARGPLSVDWQAWAATIALRYPVGERTPFEEVRRLPSMATMHRRRFGGTQIRGETSPWEDTEPRVGIGPASERVVEAMDASLEGVEGEVICPLSGGRDSRLLFCALARDGRVARAITTSDDEGDTHEEALAEPVAAASGVPHERLMGAAADYTSDWEERARRVEY
jgi:asparagine synthetase B (glutamine-hydrolysing)